MPTPFTHLALAAQLLRSARLPRSLRASLEAAPGPFLLGNLAADARISSGIVREQTHFYAYDRPISERPWRVMLARYPALRCPADVEQRVCVAGYVAHLALDEVWSLRVVRPYFGMAEWAPPRERFLILNALLVSMDTRDYESLEPWLRPELLAAEPHGWLPFLADGDLAAWRDLVGRQLPRGGKSETLAIIAERLGMTSAALREAISAPEATARLRANVPPVAVAEAEAAMAEQARRDLLAYWAESAVAGCQGGAARS